MSKTSGFFTGFMGGALIVVLIGGFLEFMASFTGDPAYKIKGKKKNRYFRIVR